jgi:hypothetical protein
MCDEEEEKMKLATNQSNNLSDHPNYKRKIPRLEVVKGVVKANANDASHRKWFEKFKENN